MRILLVCGEHQYGDSTRGNAYEFTNFLPSLRELDHEVSHFESFNKNIYADSVDMNRQFLQQVQLFKPDVIFCILMSYEIWLETLELAKKISGAALLHWSTDDSWKFEEFSRWIAPVFDQYITTYASAITKAQRAGWQNFVLSQWAASTKEAQNPIASEDCIYDVSFVGLAYGDRKKWITALEKRVYLSIVLVMVGQMAPCFAEKMIEIIRTSRVTLNFSDGSKRWHGWRRIREQQIKARVFEVPGAGGCLLTEHCSDLKNYYEPGKEVLTFHDVKSCFEAIKFLLNNPSERDKIARNGFEKTITHHTYPERFKKILANIKTSSNLMAEKDVWLSFNTLS